MGILNHRGLAVVSGQTWPGVRYFTTTRYRDFKTASDALEPYSSRPTAPYDAFNLARHVGDDDDAVRIQRQRLVETLPGKPIWLEQVHGTDVLDADTYDIQSDPTTPVADAAVTSQVDRVLCIMTADCLPVVIASDCASVLGVAHAGWRGLAAGVLENMFALMQRKVDDRTASWRAWIGPAIGQDAFEVGGEVQTAFVNQDPAAALYFKPGLRPEKWHADLSGLAQQRLALMGVSHIEAARMCTYAAPGTFYSYRRDGRTGRMATIAWLSASDLP